MATTTKSYVIPLRKSFQLASPSRRTPRAVKAIKTYLVKHCKVEEVKLGAKLNELLWSHGRSNPPARVSVDVLLTEGVAKAELTGHVYKEAAKPKRKEEPKTLKDKIASKLGAPEEKKPAAEEGQDSSEEKPKKKAASKKKEAQD